MIIGKHADGRIVIMAKEQGIQPMLRSVDGRWGRAVISGAEFDEFDDILDGAARKNLFEEALKVVTFKKFAARLADAVTVGLALNYGAVCNCPLGYMLDLTKPAPLQASHRLVYPPWSIPEADIHAFIGGFDGLDLWSEDNPYFKLGQVYRARFKKLRQPWHKEQEWVHLRDRMHRFLRGSGTKWPEFGFGPGSATDSKEFVDYLPKMGVEGWRLSTGIKEGA